MENETPKIETLEALAVKIARYANEADEKTIEAAMLLREARERLEAEGASTAEWYSWAGKNIKLSETRLRELLSIAEAEDPQKELKRQRNMTRKRVERHREKKKSAPLRNGGPSLKETAEIEEERQSLIEWARSAPLDRVTEALSYIRRFDSADAVSSSSQPAEPFAT
jgi:hypothetical protein